ncbi:MAG: serine/threonine-protein kinase, partial [Planctomycetota bacterium]
MRRITFITLAVALVLGAGAAWWGLPAWRRAAAIRDIVDEDAARRARGWRWLTTEQQGALPAVTLLPLVNEALAGAGDAALRDGMDVLLPLQRWGWPHQPASLVLRAARVLADSRDPDERQLAADLMLSCPLDADVGEVEAVIDPLLRGNDPSVRASALRAAAGWAGPRGGDWIAARSVAVDDHALRRRSLLMLAAAQPPPTVEPDVDSWPAQPAPLVEAWAMLQVHAHPDQAGAVLELRRRWSGEPAPAWSAVLRYSSDPEATATLRRAEARGDRAARFALQARDATREAARAREVATNPQQPAWRRRLAVWRWPDVPPPLAREVLDLDPTEPDGSVYAAALLAERTLARDLAVDRAEAWIRSFDDDRKRAGALL